MREERWREGWQVSVAVGVTGSRRYTDERDEEMHWYSTPDPFFTLEGFLDSLRCSISWLLHAGGTSGRKMKWRSHGPDETKKHFAIREVFKLIKRCPSQLQMMFPKVEPYESSGCHVGFHGAPKCVRAASIPLGVMVTEIRGNNACALLKRLLFTCSRHSHS